MTIEPGIEQLPSGHYRVRVKINGKTHDLGTHELLERARYVVRAVELVRAEQVYKKAEEAYREAESLMEARERGSESYTPDPAKSVGYTNLNQHPGVRARLQEVVNQVRKGRYSGKVTDVEPSK